MLPRLVPAQLPRNSLPRSLHVPPSAFSLLLGQVNTGLRTLNLSGVCEWGGAQGILVHLHRICYGGSEHLLLPDLGETLLTAAQCGIQAGWMLSLPHCHGVTLTPKTGEGAERQTGDQGAGLHAGCVTWAV